MIAISNRKTLFVLMTTYILILNDVTYAINWSGKNWAMSCDFKENNLFNVRIPGELCGGKCNETPECTHFAWTDYNGGTCWLKKGPISKDDAFPTNDPTMVCGVKEDGNGGSSSSSGSSNANNFEAQVFKLTNEARKTGRFCGNDWYPATTKLKWNNKLGNAAREHAQDMLAQNYFDHTSKDGRTPWDRMANAGYPRDCAAAENISGNSDPDAAVSGWLKSTGHCVNIMNSEAKVMGVGQVAGGPYGAYWVQTFGRC